MKNLLPLLAAIIFATPSFGQQAMQMGIELQERHGTLELLESEEGKQALRDFEAMKNSGQLPLSAGKRADEVGDTVTFSVFNFQSSSVEDISFVLKRKEPLFNMWAEVAELNNGNVSESAIDDLLGPLGVATPAPSYNPSKGIIENNNDVFGAPPNVDGDGLTDVFLVDVRDDYNGSNGFVAGFFSPTDLSGGNMRDIIYIDTNPGFSRGTDKVAQTLAHEYQHLIHAEYDINEETFVNEGLSEYAEVMNGYDGRNIAFLSDVTEHSTDLYTWRSSNPFFDYQRGKLFTTFISEQYDVLTAGSITRSPQRGSSGYRDILGDQEFKDIIVDFYTANFLNDTAVDPAYGHLHSTHTSLSTPSDYDVDGRTTDITNSTDVTLGKGGVYYATWSDAEDLEVNVVATGTRLAIRALVTQDGSTTVTDLDPSAGTYNFAGLADVTLIFADTNPSGFTPIDFSYDAMWTISGGEVITESVVFDDGQLGASPFSFGSTGDGRVATLFEVPFGSVATLDRIEISPSYFSHFSGQTGVPATAPRDMAIKVWEVAEGIPTTELYSKDVVDSRSTTALFQTLEFFEVDLSADAAQLTGLPDQIAIGYAEIGTDNNYFVIAPVDYTDGNISFFAESATSQWFDVYGTELQSGESMSGHAIPVRATFLLPKWTGTEDDVAEIPAVLALNQNYPNPFNPVTTIQFALPTPQDISLTVYDMLGRAVETLAAGPRAAGSHSIVFDASGFASGMYIYKLETGTDSITKTMMLLK